MVPFLVPGHILIEAFKIKFSIGFVKRLNLESVIRSILSSAKLQSFLHSYGCLKSQNMICNFQWLQQSYKVFIQPLLWLHENFVILLPENDYSLFIAFNPYLDNITPVRTITELGQCILWPINILMFILNKI